jgi:hypothetical protein
MRLVKSQWSTAMLCAVIELYNYLSNLLRIFHNGLHSETYNYASSAHNGATEVSTIRIQMLNGDP